MMLWLLAALAVAADDAPPFTLDLVDADGLIALEQPPAPAEGTVVLDGARILPGDGRDIAEGYVVFTDGRIVEVGEGKAPAREGAKVVDVSGKTVTPGIIDTHSHLGVYPSPSANAHSDGNEMTHPTTPGVWAEHSVWPQDPGFQRALEGGVTTLQVLPGSANLVGGRGVVLHNIPARGSRAMRLPGAPETIKMACGENPKRVYGDKGGPATRMGNLYGQRGVYLDAKSTLEAWQTYLSDKAEWDEASATWETSKTLSKRKREKEGIEPPGDEPQPPDRDLDAETLMGVLSGEVLVQVHCYRADDMLSMLQVSKEMGFHVRSFHHALEAYKIRDVLAAHEVSVSTWADWWGFKLEAYDGIPYNLAMVHDAGARAVVHSDSAIGIQRLNQEAAKGLAAGRAMGLELTDADAITWLTANPAWTLGVLDDVGTLEPGKRADVVVWSGSPLSVYTSAEKVFIDGHLRHDSEQPREVWSDFEIGQQLGLEVSP